MEIPYSPESPPATMATFNIYGSFYGTKIAQKYCVLRKIQFLRKFVASLAKHNKSYLFRLSDKAADGFLTISFFEKISKAPSRCHGDNAPFDLDYFAIAFVVYQTQ
jgi:hypothetical protein